LFDGDPRVIASAYKKALQSLEEDGEQGMSPEDQRRLYGISLDSYAAMGRLLSHLGMISSGLD